MAISIIKFREKKAYGVYSFLCDFDSDVKNLRIDCAPGSKAYVVESGKSYIFNSFKKWEEIKNNSSNNNDIDLNNYVTKEELNEVIQQNISLDSPHFTGIPTAPTASSETNTE